MAESLPRTIPIKRRNGKLQSCEPCRKRKLSCDHRLPACGRCIRRGTAANCYYHPAPLTRPVEDVVLSAPPTSTSALSPARHAAKRLAQAQPAEVAAAHTSVLEQRQPGILRVPSAGILMETNTLPTKVGFLGDSSSSAVVAELNSSLGIRPASEESNNTPRRACLSEVNARNGAEVLTFFQDIDRIGQLIGRSLSFTDAHLVFQPIYRVWYDGLETFFAKAREAILFQKLATISLSIWRNTQRPLPSTCATSAKEWALHATGDELRWETLGLLAATIGSIAGSLPQWDPMFSSLGTGFEKRTLMHTALHLCKICVDLSKQCGSRSDLLPLLLYERVLLTANLRGDTSIECWTAFGELCDAVTLQGLHLEQKLDEKTPFFLYELRVRLFNAVFSLDKFLATFLGRPPKVSYRYAVLQELHDLSDDELCMQTPQLNEALSKLQNGWTTSGSPHRATWRKAWFKRFELREDILEIVIGPHTHNLDAQLEHVHRKERELLQAMPDFLRSDPEQLIDNIKRDPSYPMIGRGAPWSPSDVHRLIAIHGNARHGEFLLERAVANKRKTDSSRMIAAARRSMSLIMKALGLGDYCGESHSQTAYLLAFYAIPTAGVLAMEVLKRDQVHEIDDSFPRSEIIQQLSVLAAALETVGSGDGNYNICVMGLSSIRKVLDRLLSKPPVQITQKTGVDIFDSASFGTSIGNDADFLQWLGGVDFDANSWLDPSPSGYYSGGSDVLMQT